MRERDGIDLLVIIALIGVVLVIALAPLIDWTWIIVGAILVALGIARVFLPMPGQAGIRWRKEDKNTWDGWIGPGKDDDPKA
jgi:hypothetical protein